MMHGGGWMFGMGWLFWLLILLVVGGVIWAAAKAARGGRPPSTTGQHGSSPEEVLRQRFARGEIDEEEYRTRLATLREHD